MTALGPVIDTLAPDGEVWVIEAPAAWAQGRTLYGGITAALAYEAIRRGLGDLGPLRSSQFMFVGPASGRLRFEPKLLRRGRSSAMVGVECLNEEGVAARATFAFGSARESKVTHDLLAMPNVAPADACPPFRKGASPTRGFWDNFETRLAAGGRIFDNGADHPTFSVWTRFLDVGGADPMTALLALADCLPPAAVTQFPGPAPISTITWTVDVLAPPTNIEGWHLLHAASDHSASGYSMQSMMLWDGEGRPLAVGRQAVAIFV